LIKSIALKIAALRFVPPPGGPKTSEGSVGVLKG